MRARRVHVHIDSLALGNFQPGDRMRVAQGFRTELERLLGAVASGAGRVEGKRLSSIRFDDLHVSPNAPADRWGRAAARRVVKGVWS